MSSFPNIYSPLLYGGMYGLGWGFPALPRVVEEKDVREPAKPTGKPQTHQQMLGYFGIGAADDAWLRGYADAPPGNYKLWRMMSRQPTIALARAVATGPIISGTRTIEARQQPGQKKRRTPITGDGVISSPEDKRAEFCCGVLEPLFPELIRDMLRALVLGHKPFEVVWDAKDGQAVISRFKPLKNEFSYLMTEPGGKLVGIQQNDVKLWGADCFNYANDPEDDYWFGTSRMQNMREEWWAGLQDWRRLGALADKAVGISMAVKGPVGTGRVDTNGNAIDGPGPAQNVANEVAKQRPVWMPKNLIPLDPDKSSDVEYLKAWSAANEAAAFELEQFDWGDTSPMAVAILNRQVYRDSTFFRGWFHPEREALEAKGGTKADAGFHGQVGTMDCDLTHADICRAISHGPLNDLLERNFGPDARDTVCLEAAPLVDAKRQELMTLMEALEVNPQIQLDLWKKLDKAKALTSLNYPLLDGVDANEEIAPPPTPVVAPPGAPVNGNGNGNGNANGKANGTPNNGASKAKRRAVAAMSREIVDAIGTNRMARIFREGEAAPNVTIPKKTKHVKVKRGDNGELSADITED